MTPNDDQRPEDLADIHREKTTPRRSLRPGDVVRGNLEVMKPPKRGGMGVVYQVMIRGLGQPCALKMLPRRSMGAPAVRCFEREARTAALLDHPGIVKVDAGR